MADPLGFLGETTGLGGAFGGETDAQRRQREEKERLLREGRDKGIAAIESVPIPGMPSASEQIAQIDDLLSGRFFEITPEERVVLENQRSVLVPQAEREGVWTPASYTPERVDNVQTYEAQGYTPTTYDPVTEKALAEQYGPDFSRYNILGEDVTAQDPSLAATAMADVQGLGAQREALEGIQDIYKQGGMTAIDRARWEEAKRRNEQIARSQREADLAALETKGRSGSGAGLLAMLNASQGAAQRQSAESLGIEAQAQQRAMEALGLAGGMGRALASDEFGRQYQKGTAQDIINQFNTMNLNEAERRRVEAENKAAADYAQWERDRLMRDTTRQEAANRYGADVTNLANQWNTGQQNQANQFNTNWQNIIAGQDVDRMNQAQMWNVANTNEALKVQAMQPWQRFNAQTGQASNVANLYSGYGQNQLAIPQIQAPDYSRLFDVGSAFTSALPISGGQQQPQPQGYGGIPQYSVPQW